MTHSEMEIVLKSIRHEINNTLGDENWACRLLGMSRDQHLLSHSGLKNFVDEMKACVEAQRRETRRIISGIVIGLTTGIILLVVGILVNK